MDGKKISFGFMKTKKVEKPVVEEKKDFIECVEEKSIKVVGGDEIKENAPLVIPMKPNTLVTSERLKEIAVKVESALEEPDTIETASENNLPQNETLDQMVVRELLEESKKAIKVETSQLMLTLPAKSVTSGEKESTLDDYESVPVQEFGLAMLRGMGWTQTKDASKFKQPQLRPKGLGLGADKVVKDNMKQKATKNSKDEELSIVKNAHVKITAGKYSGYYGKVVSLDDDNGRVMVDITVKKETVSLSEFMMHPVTKGEFDKESKVINANSFEQYKKGEGGQKSSKSSESSSREINKDRNERESESSREKDNHRKSGRESDSSKNRERNRDRSNRERRDSSEELKKKDSRYSSNESLSSISDSERRRKKKKSKRYSSTESLDSGKNKIKERKRRDSSESDRKSKMIDKERRRHYCSDSDSDHRRAKRSVTPDGKRDIDKKRKGKKKKRDRDRSPNHRKHRK